MVRSQAYSPPSPLPPILNDIATLLPLPKKAYRSLDDSAIPLSSLDPDTSTLLPSKKRTHHVWVQGKLAPVRRVSIANLRKPSTKPSSLLLPSSPGTPSSLSRDPSPSTPRFSKIATIRRRHSFGDEAGSDFEEDEDDRKEAARRDSQLRGYGIGGAGNIRRPTDVIHGPTRPGTIAGRDSNTQTPRSSSPESADADKQRSGIRELLGLVPDRKGKARAY